MFLRCSLRFWSHPLPPAYSCSVHIQSVLKAGKCLATINFSCGKSSVIVKWKAMFETAKTYSLSANQVNAVKRDQYWHCYKRDSSNKYKGQQTNNGDNYFQRMIFFKKTFEFGKRRSGVGHFFGWVTGSKWVA